MPTARPHLTALGSTILAFTMLGGAAGAAEAGHAGTPTHDVHAASGRLSCGLITDQDRADARYLNGVLTQKLKASMTPYRLSCARQVVQAVRARGLSPRAAEIALSVVIVETGLENLGHGHLDSVGLFQQRSPWGSFADRTNPTKSTHLFLDRMIHLYGQRRWQTVAPGTVAAEVQKPAARYRDRYARTMSDAVRIAGRLWEQPTARTTASGYGDFTGDGIGDVLVRDTRGRLIVYAGSGNGGLRSGRAIGEGWGRYTGIVRADFDGDRRQDVIGRDARGRLTFYKGAGAGLRPGVLVKGTAGWQQFRTLLSPGDLDRDGKADLLAIRPDGTLWFYAGTGRPGVRAGVKIGAGWGVYATVVAPGDLTGDGRPDLLAMKPNGELRLYKGTGTGRVTGSASSPVVGRGWTQFRHISGAGDLTKDGRNDVIGVTSKVTTYRGSGTPTGALSKSVTFGAGWQNFDAIF